MRDKTVSWLIILSLLGSQLARAEGPSNLKPLDYSSVKDLSQIPSQPSQPPDLIQREVEDFAHCERFFLFSGKKYECDSNLGRDAERLRPLMQDVPQAIQELDLYQKNLRDVRVSGYLITSGVLLVALGMILSGGQPFNPASGGISLGGGIAMAGFTLGVGSVVHGFTLVNLNEKHIQKAVDHYNGVHPDQPIQLQFSTAIGSKLIQ